MKTYTTKTIIVGRGKKITEGKYPVLVSFFDEADPHLKGTPPKEVIDFQDVEKVSFKGLDVDYFLAGSDLVMNNLSAITIEKKENILIVKKK